MHNTTTKYIQMHNKKLYHEMTIEYLSLFVSWVGSFLSLQLHHLHNSIISYPNAKMDKRFFKIWVLRIPHRLRDLLWMVRDWSWVVLKYCNFKEYSMCIFLWSLMVLSGEPLVLICTLMLLIERTNKSHEVVPSNWQGGSLSPQCGYLSLHV